MTAYRSLVKGGFYSSTPLDKESGPVAIRMNNPGAVNVAGWVRTWPGFVDAVVTSTSIVKGRTVKNTSVIFETPEHGISAWHELMRKYNVAGAKTVKQIIWRYGGGQTNYATTYLNYVRKHTGFNEDHEIKLSNTTDLLKFAKAMFRHEAGEENLRMRYDGHLPWLDEQILHGFKIGKNRADIDRQTFNVVVPAASAVAAGGIAAASGVDVWTMVMIVGAVLLVTSAIVAIVRRKGT